MKASEQIKGAIRNISKKTGVNPNSLLQMCLFEGILEKLSKSKYSENFILKGGLLISSLIGVDMRSTMDMDTTLRGIPLNEESISNILNEILAIKIDTDIEYKLIKLSPIRQEDVYEDFCASIFTSCPFPNRRQGKAQKGMADLTEREYLVSLASHARRLVLFDCRRHIGSSHIFATR